MAHPKKKQLKIGLAAYGIGWDHDAWRLPRHHELGVA